jgi:hypothetical protein
MADRCMCGVRHRTELSFPVAVYGSVQTEMFIVSASTKQYRGVAYIHPYSQAALWALKASRMMSKLI